MVLGEHVLHDRQPDSRQAGMATMSEWRNAAQDATSCSVSMCSTHQLLMNAGVQLEAALLTNAAEAGMTD